MLTEERALAILKEAGVLLEGIFYLHRAAIPTGICNAPKFSGIPIMPKSFAVRLPRSFQTNRSSL